MTQTQLSPQERYRNKPGVKEYYAEKQRARRLADPEKYRLMGRKYERRRKLKRYGLTEQAYRDLLQKQNNLCAICFSSRSSKRDWHVDHNHETGEIRGVLCHHCNLMLGNAKDRTPTLLSAIFYLRKNNGTDPFGRTGLPCNPK